MIQENKYDHRMGYKQLKLMEADGAILSNAKITIEQKKHEFLFGGVDYGFIGYANNSYSSEDIKEMDRVFMKFKNLFNYTTLPFYWGPYEPEKGKAKEERTKVVAELFKSNGFRIKGHALCWHENCPSWLPQKDLDKVFSLQTERIEREIRNFEGIIDIWDVVNEAVIMPIYKNDNVITELCKKRGRFNMIREMFHVAKRVNPKAKFSINDFIVTDGDMTSYEILIEGCLQMGIPIDIIGIQSQMHKGCWSEERMLEVLDRFSKFNIPIHFTECTLVSGHTMPDKIVDYNDYVIDHWASTPEGEIRQAKEAAQFYEMLFSNPQVESVTWWEFMDGQWLGAPTGFITRDYRVKPIYDEMYNLIKGKWWTDSFETVTNEKGVVNVSGFLGEYEISCHDKKGNFVLNKGRKDETCQVIIC